MNRFTRWALALAVMAGALLVTSPAQASTTTLPSGQQVTAAELATFRTTVAASPLSGNFVVDPASPGPGAYCIRSWGPDAQNGYGAGWWKAFVARGQYASWIDACGYFAIDNSLDVDGVYIDPSHWLSANLLICPGPSYAPGCYWAPWGIVGSNHNHKISGGQTWLFKVNNGYHV